MQQKLSEAVMNAVRTGHIIQAIKQLRAEEGLGLKEAKDIIDREVAEYRAQNPQAHVREGARPWPMAVVVALLVVALYLYLTKAA